jgi:hypothetical protein
VRISLLDHSGLGLGLAAGLVQLGHAVRYVGPQPWPGEEPRDVGRMQQQLIDHYLGGCADSVDQEDDLLIVMSSLADELAALAHRLYAGERVDLTSPLRWTLNPGIYPVRLQMWIDLAASMRNVIVVDCSDSHGEREVVFEQMANATLLAREVPLDACSPWQPFPFLYNPVLLWLELMRPEREWLLPASVRKDKWDWAFCGTVNHARYGNERSGLLAEVEQRWPGLRGFRTANSPYIEVLKELQSSRCGLDLPGAGEVCFRMHEYLALGVPMLRPWPFRVTVAKGIERAMITDPQQLGGLDVEAVRAIYREHYSPRAAAEALLASVGRVGPLVRAGAGGH